MIHSQTRSLLLIALSGSIMGLLPACSVQQTNHQRNRDMLLSSTEHIEDPIRTLEARAELELINALEPASDEILRSISPGSLDELLVGTPAYQRAMGGADLVGDETIESFEASLWEQDAGAVEPIDPRSLAQAQKLYAQARSHRQSGDLNTSIELLKQASSIDRSSSSLFRELGDALIVSNDRVGAIRAYERAIELGDRSPRALVYVASEVSSQGNEARAIGLCALAMRERSIENHPMARSIAGVLLGTSQIRLGYLKVGAQTLEEALDSFDTNSRDLRWKREIIQVMSQRSGLWILTGDAWASIGAHQRAQDAYNKADSETRGQHSPIALVARQLGSALRQGHPASASLIFLAHIENNATDLGVQELNWSRALSSFDGIGDVLSSAIAPLGEYPEYSPSVKRSLLGIELSALDTQGAVARLGSAGVLAKDSLMCLRVLKGIESDADRIEAAGRILDENPGISRAVASGLTRTLMDPVAFLKNTTSSESPADQLLICSVGIGLGRADLIGHLELITREGDELRARSTPWLSAHAQAFSLVGQWSRGGELITVLEERATSGDRLAMVELASTLLVAQQPRASLELIRTIGDDADAEVGELLLASQIAQTLLDYEAGLAFLERALELDPYNEKIVEQLFTLRSSASPVGDQDELQFIVRQLSTTRPRSSLFGLLRAGELARNGMLDEAQELLFALNNQYPYREIGYDLLLSIWQTQSSQGTPEAMVEGLAWLEGRLEADPNSVQGIIKLAQGLFGLGGIEDADRGFELLEQGYARTGSFELARALEAVFAGPMENTPDARIHTDTRLGGLLGLDPTIEYCSGLAQRGDAGSIGEVISRLGASLGSDSATDSDSGLGSGVELLPEQLAQLTQVVFALVDTIEVDMDEALAQSMSREILDLVTLIEGHVSDLGSGLGSGLTRVRVVLLAQDAELDIDHLIGVLVAAGEGIELDAQRDQLFALPIQSLLSENRTHEAIAMLIRLASLDGVLDADFLVETYRMLGAVGTNSDILGVLEVLEERGLVEESIALLTGELGTPERGTPAVTLDQQRADLVYTAAVMASAFEREEQAMPAYELALSYDIDHAWSNNDYGYMLAELGDRMEDAVELLERAARVLPDEASVIDSLAWARYKMGVFEDVASEDGGKVIAGAISLLMRANALDIERENSTIMLHLGDALWRGGYTERASNAWIGAEDIARSRIRLLSAQPTPNKRAIDALSDELREIRYRLQDADSTGTPTIAPLGERYVDELGTEPGSGLEPEHGIEQ